MKAHKIHTCDCNGRKAKTKPMASRVHQEPRGHVTRTPHYSLFSVLKMCVKISKDSVLLFVISFYTKMILFKNLYLSTGATFMVNLTAMGDRNLKKKNLIFKKVNAFQQEPP